MRFLWIAVLSSALAGCGAARSERLAAQDDTTCKSYGAQPGSERYQNCRLQLAQIRATEDQADAAIIGPLIAPRR